MKIYFGPAVGRSYEPDFISCLLKLLAIKDHQILFRPQYNDALVSRSRSIAASQFLKSDCDVFLSIDTDIVFKAEDAIRLCEHALALEGVLVGLYKTRQESGIPASLLYKGTVVDSTASTVAEIRYGATGFMAFRRDVAEQVASLLPLCHEDEAWAFYPMFQPFVADDDDGNPIYLSEDYAFCKRAAVAGFPTYCLPDVRLGHVGPYLYAFPEGPYRLERLDAPGVKYRLESRELAPQL